MKIHIVKKGDTLYELAKKYHITLDQLIAFNPQIADPNQLDIGMKVKIPSKPKPVEPPANEIVYKHIVQQGDSLWKLGKAWDVPLPAMIAANPQLKNPNVLMTGEVVYVPKLNLEGEAMQPPSSSKPSTMPFDHMPEAQPVEPIEANQPAQEAIPEAAPPMMPIAQEPIPEAALQAPSIPAPAPKQPGVPLTSMPEVPEAEPGVISLEEPYEQPAVHPFKQFHIAATEVFAYPGSEQHEADAFPAFSPYQHHQHHHQQHQQPWEQAPLNAQQNSFPVSSEGCGCGGPSMMEQPWMAAPEGFPSGFAASPWDGHQQGVHHGFHEGYHHGMPVMPSSYAPGFPHDMGQAMHDPFAFHPGPYGIPYAGDHYQAPYESPMMPQVHTHQLAEETDKEEVVEIDIRSNKPSKSKNGRSSSKKAKSSGNDSLHAFLKRQQRASLENEEAKPNVPWINF
ncbi:LysM peptidoglycan-binding domain-containing protein [Paenibacillus planticolens]|uniref:LysM peptidoglycan-binding domain-containing protein n=1 Tax=Paenibacillus planticolens TaxID=2654976 RepID=A0ABX1ZVS0_9BACL|nr:LysM peptidoglycan-binding domain-containing protein [Paenibacillus planticolens]NOV04094.1 LysM peptidoglycan-binding domain-containing protein [Paenibacillus planticolens]